jgi:choline dehydrogenase-like flavoprotein
VKPLEELATPDRMRRYDGHVDVCIVGCGAAGAVLAKELAEAGWKVVVLEAGEWLSTDADLRQDEVQMRGRFDWDDRRWFDGSEPLEMGHPRDGGGVGGGTIHFGGVSLRLWPQDFERRSRDGVSADWPISYWDLEPYYDHVEQELQLSGPQQMPWGPHPHAYPQPPHRMTARDLLVARGMETLGMRWCPTPLAILTGRHESRSPCMNYGYCQWGCKSRAKTSMHVSYVPKAVLAGAEIRPRSRAVQLEVDDATGEISGVVYADEDVTVRQTADVYILSAFCIENPRLLLHSATAIPRRARELLGHRRPLPARPHRRERDGTVRPTRPPVVHRPRHAALAAPLRHPAGTRIPRRVELDQLLAVPRRVRQRAGRHRTGDVGRRLVDELEAYPHWLVLGSEGESLPYADNRVELSDERDEFGVPRPQVTFDFGEHEQAMRAAIHHHAQEILEAAGAEKILHGQGNDHTMGGCRMGDDPASSVVDPNCRSWDHPNLFICDASVFVTPGGAQPGQTIMALAARLADDLSSHRVGPRVATAERS